MLKLSEWAKKPESCSCSCLSEEGDSDGGRLGNGTYRRRGVPGIEKDMVVETGIMQTNTLEIQTLCDMCYSQAG